MRCVVFTCLVDYYVLLYYKKYPGNNTFINIMQTIYYNCIVNK